MERVVKWLALGVVAVSLVACASKAKKDEAVGEEPMAGEAAEQDTRYAVGEGGPIDAKAMLNDPSSPLSKRVFYFEFDRSDISEEDRRALQAHAEFLAQHPAITVVIEGHADERGTREYNMALGERRSKAISQLLVLQGGSKSQLQEISFGEERPVALGHDESAWSLNRRAELLYSGY
jgi:peptidoglycan-associated lipoprotein